MADKIRQYSERTDREIQEVLRRERQRTQGTRGEPRESPVELEERGGAAISTSIITAATGTVGSRVLGTGTMTVYRRNRTTNVEEAVPGLADVPIYNNTTQTLASGEPIQYMVDDTGDRYWDVAGSASGGYAARITTEITAASGTSPRSFGSGVVDLYKKDGSDESELVEEDVDVFNTSGIVGAEDMWIQVKRDPFGTYWWDVADCVAEE